MIRFDEISDVLTSKFPIIACPDIPDDPSRYFWRASLSKSGYIELWAFPVVRRTEFGAWIDPDGYVTSSRQLDYNPTSTRLKFMIVNSHRSYAKTHRDLAIASLLHRAVRRAEHVNREAALLRRFSAAIPTLFPEEAEFSQKILAALEEK